MYRNSRIAILSIGLPLLLAAGCEDGVMVEGDMSAAPDLGAARDLAAAPDLTAQPDLTAPPQCAKLDDKLTWYGTNRTRLDDFMKAQGRCSASYDPMKKPIAVFDWDNTVVKNDVGDATFFYMLAHDKILQPPAKNWRLTSPFLTADAIAALDAACAAAADAGKPLPTSTNAACAKEIVTIYYDGKTTGGKAPFANWNYRRMEPAYAWVAELLAGYTKGEIQSFAQQAKMENTTNPVDTKQTIGGVSLTHWVRIYDQIKDLIAKLNQNGFDVWVVSASPQAIVEVWAKDVGVEGDHVIGIRNREQSGKYVYDLQGCGDVPDGTNDGTGNVTGNSMITYIDGKRCWVNKVIYGDTSAAAVQKIADAAKRHVFGAGDSDTDITFLQDATALKLVLNRNKKEIMCNAYGNAGGKWIINPMFIQPRSQQTSAYTCSSNACKNASGASVPCVDEDGKTIPDQMDTVF